MAINEICGATRNNAKNVMFKALRGIFSKGFSTWKMEGGKNLFDGQTFQTLKVKDPSISRRFFYLCEISWAFSKFLGELKRAEEWLDIPDIEAVIYSRSLMNRRKLENEYKIAFGKEAPMQEDLINVTRFNKEDAVTEIETPQESGAA